MRKISDVLVEVMADLQVKRAAFVVADRKMRSLVRENTKPRRVEVVLGVECAKPARSRRSPKRAGVQIGDAAVAG